jgi:hypothetical protein
MGNYALYAVTCLLIALTVVFGYSLYSEQQSSNAVAANQAGSASAR